MNHEMEHVEMEQPSPFTRGLVAYAGPKKSLMPFF
jgi:hypothetical protein